MNCTDWGPSLQAQTAQLLNQDCWGDFFFFFPCQHLPRNSLWSFCRPAGLSHMWTKRSAAHLEILFFSLFITTWTPFFSPLPSAPPCAWAAIFGALEPQSSAVLFLLCCGFFLQLYRASLVPFFLLPPLTPLHRFNLIFWYCNNGFLGIKPLVIKGNFKLRGFFWGWGGLKQTQFYHNKLILSKL